MNTNVFLNIFSLANGPGLQLYSSEDSCEYVTVICV